MRFPLLLLFVTLGLGALARAQVTTDGVVKATVTMLGDGRQKNVIVDPEKKMADETILDQRGKLLTRTVYALDERNLFSRATYYDGKGKVLYTATFMRDAADRVAEEAYLSTTGKPLGRRVYHYGAGNKVAQIDVYDANGNLVVPPKPVSPGRPDKKRR